MGSPSGNVSSNTYLDTVLIAGSPVHAEYDYTDPSVAAEYYAQIQILNNLYNKITSTPAGGGSAPALTADDVTQINTALANLQNLASNGLVANSTANIYPPVVTLKKYYLTTQMANDLDLIYRSFNAVGATGTPPVLTLDSLAKWKDLSIVSPAIQNVLTGAINAVASNRSLQAMVETDYVKAGSDMIGDKLSNMNDALTVTNNVLNSLSSLQDIKNRLVVTDPSGYKLPTSAMVNKDGGVHAVDIMSAYRGAASAYFNAPIVPQVAPTLLSADGTSLSTAGVDTYKSLVAIQKSLLLFLPQLSAIVGPDGVKDPASIYNRIKKIAGDLSAFFQAKGVPGADLTDSKQQAIALKTYLLDNKVSAFFVPGHNAGDGQADLNFGITSAQGLNDTQKEDVKNFLNIFQQFYQSASAILQAMTQMIEKMAQNISR